MNETSKKVLISVVAVAALVAAVFGAMRFFGQDQMVIDDVRPAPPGFVSEKERFLQDQQKNQGGQPAGGKEADLGGPIGGQ